MQERPWFLDRLAPGRSVAGASFALRLCGPLDRPALAGALDDLTARHESLRTRLVVVEGRPRQVIDSPAARPLPVEHLGACGSALREARLRVPAARDASRPFDLATGPPFRARLVRLSPDEHVLFGGAHRAVFGRRSWLAERLDAGPGTVDATEAEVERRFAANTRAIAGYHPTAPVETPALIVSAESSADSAPDWRTAMHGPVETIRVPGDHWTLLRPPADRRVAPAILAR